MEDAMSKISDDIRKRLKNNISLGFLDPCSSIVKFMRTIADRIDREMMERPLAADGKLLVDGETVYDSNGNKYHVNEVYPLVNVSTSTYSCSMFPDRFTHERPDSLERIAEEIEKADVDGCTDWAGRIRKLAKEREHE